MYNFIVIAKLHAIEITRDAFILMTEKRRYLSKHKTREEKNFYLMWYLINVHQIPFLQMFFYKFSKNGWQLIMNYFYYIIISFAEISQLMFVYFPRLLNIGFLCL